MNNIMFRLLSNLASISILFSNLIKNKSQKIKWKLHFYFPNFEFLISKRDREYYREKDAEDNQNIKIPENETLDTISIWGAELFGPSEIESLYEGFSRLGWDVARFGEDSEGAVQWIKEQRMYGSVGTYKIGFVAKRGETRFLGLRYFAPIPEGVDNLIVIICQLSPSLTCVAVGFSLTELVGARYRHELDLDRKSIRRKTKRKGVIATYSVEHLKAEAIDKARALQRSIATDWFKQNLPGFFSNIKDGKRLPTAEILLTEIDTCFPASREAARQCKSVWRRLVARVSSTNVWISDGCKGLQLVMDELTGDARYHLIMALRKSDVSDNQLEHFGGRERRAWSAFCDDYISGVLAYYASIAFLREGERTVKLTREQLKQASNNGGIIKTLEKIKYYFTESIGLPTIASELKSGAKHEGGYRHWCQNFTAENWQEGAERHSLPEVFRFRTKALAARFIKEEAASREQFEQLSSIMNTQESVKAQRRMERLTWGAIILAFASLLAALPVHDLHEKLRTVISQLGKLP